MKTKIMSVISWTVAIIILGFASIGVVAQELPIGSQDVLRNYALSVVTRGVRVVSSPSMDWNQQDSVTYTNVTGKGGEDVLDKLFAAELKYRVINTNDTIQGYVYLYDKYDNLVFFGYAQFTIADLKKDVKPRYGIWIQNVPLPLENVESAEILALDEDGKTARHYGVSVDQYGHPLFMPWMSGAPNGILVVRFKDGSIKRYDLSKPVGEVPGTTTEKTGWNIDDHYVYDLTCPSGYTCTAIQVKIIALWNLPTAFIKVKAGQTFAFDVLGYVQMNGNNIFERPTSMIFEQENGPWAGAANLHSDKPSEIAFPAVGNYRVRFEWMNFGKPNTLYTGPDWTSNSGGGGGLGKDAP